MFPQYDTLLDIFPPPPLAQGQRRRLVWAGAALMVTVMATVAFLV